MREHMAEVISEVSTEPRYQRDFFIRFSLRTLLLAMAMVAVIIFLISFAVRRAEAKRRQDIIKNSGEQIAIGLHNLHSVMGDPGFSRSAMSADGKWSWRFSIVPYIEQLPIDGSVPFRRSADWDAPVHAKLRAYMRRTYCWSEDKSSELTNLFGISGRDAAFERSQPPPLSRVDIDLVLAMEVADSKTHWMQPGDYEVDKLLAAFFIICDTVKGLLPDRIHVLFADGEVWALSPDTPIDAVKPFFTITSAKAASREESLSQYRVDE